ncbi:hypothetical protein [Candidatus Magnetominusculus xianensis]|uniref:Uncharacterized protein n=1 Tax=Candidatus Magnetominusculus xianensis TaxID=1748249 RepID=A0ABR5SG33_9BACT|nr:hypothetical protein [Candidatus Magnetominusculus xianensis]KWT79581.1 hypothetical protein ASN18_2735 [Candidatus Magnetominusculus xianensis]MBF0405617.1 hypothetical protein [Nitrospirota bacterium]
MIFHPGVLALVVGSVIVLVMAFFSVFLGIRIIIGWDITKSTAKQLILERQTYLITTIMKYVLGFQILSLFLFVYTADDIHKLFVGAMCTTGSLNANLIGWTVLFAKIVIFFLCAVWLAINRVDEMAEDYPLVKLKYKYLAALVPVIVLEGYWQLNYFLGLRANVITSCCSSLFSDEGLTVASSLASLPVTAAMYMFYGAAAVELALLSVLLRKGSVSSPLRYISGVWSLVFFVISIASIVAFVSIYYYETPVHHCPFDILQKQYMFIGYPLYGSLFGGILFSLGAAVIEKFKKIDSIRTQIHHTQRRWTIMSIVLLIVFIIIATWPVVFSNFRAYD